jgi:hypothetical protein
MFFLLQSRAQGYYVLVGTAVLLAICAILQVILDVALAGIGGRILELAVREGITQRVSSLNNTLMSLYNVRQVALAVNKCVFAPNIAAVKFSNIFAVPLRIYYLFVSDPAVVSKLSDVLG